MSLNFPFIFEDDNEIEDDDEMFEEDFFDLDDLEAIFEFEIEDEDELFEEKNIILH